MQPLPPSPCSQARNWLSTSPWQCGVRIWSSCTQSQPVWASQHPCQGLARPARGSPPASTHSTKGNGKLGFFGYQLLPWHRCLPLCVPLSFPESLPAAQLLERVKITFGMFSSCLKGLICFVFPSVTAEHSKRSTWKMWKMVSM